MSCAVRSSRQAPFSRCDGLRPIRVTVTAILFLLWLTGVALGGLFLFIGGWAFRLFLFGGALRSHVGSCRASRPIPPLPCPCSGATAGDVAP